MWKYITSINSTERSPWEDKHALASQEIYYFYGKREFVIVFRKPEALRYIPKDCGLHARWSHWNFSLTYSFLSHYDSGLDWAS